MAPELLCIPRKVVSSQVEVEKKNIREKRRARRGRRENIKDTRRSRPVVDDHHQEEDNKRGIIKKRRKPKLTKSSHNKRCLAGPNSPKKPIG